MITATRKFGPLAAAILTSALVLTGCAGESFFEADAPVTGTTAPGNGSSTPQAPEAEAKPEVKPVNQEETCDWGSARTNSGSTKAPSGQSGELANVLIGSWQHTHTDSGSGYEALKPTTDIRFVFPSTTRLLYCQDVAGATSQAENPANISLDGTELVLPSPATGYGVVAWDANTMVWKNNRDGSLYLLQRR